MICGPAAWPGPLLDTCRFLDPVVRCNELVCFSPDSQATHAQASLGVPVVRWPPSGHSCVLSTDHCRLLPNKYLLPLLTGLSSCPTPTSLWTGLRINLFRGKVFPGWCCPPFPLYTQPAYFRNLSLIACVTCWASTFAFISWLCSC